MTLERLPRVLLRLEGAAVAIGALALYAHADYSWLLLAILVLAPDLSAMGFLAGPRVGTLTYNAAHTTASPIVLGAIGVILPSETATAVALVWLIHIGFDRTVGYGLKYPSAFKDTHLNRI
ncbi:DUF4260 domain-containing protein [Gaiella sp.]|uniref:DUF4260 domain-containing protein n=1 Tax=Gaiella sp. TaxID=2663207 RepID=UPI003265BBAC